MHLERSNSRNVHRNRGTERASERQPRVTGDKGATTPTGLVIAPENRLSHVAPQLAGVLYLSMRLSGALNYRGWTQCIQLQRIAWKKECHRQTVCAPGKQRAQRLRVQTIEADRPYSHPLSLALAIDQPVSECTERGRFAMQMTSMVARKETSECEEAKKRTRVMGVRGMVSLAKT